MSFKNNCSEKLATELQMQVEILKSSIEILKNEKHHFEKAFSSHKLEISMFEI